MGSKKNQEEYLIQKAVFAWAEIERVKRPELFLLEGSINGVKLTIGQIVKAKKAGMKKATPDIRLPVPSGKYHGLYVELKTKNGKIDPDQKDYLKALGHYGNFACVCRGYRACVGVIRAYIDGRIDEFMEVKKCLE